MIRALLTLVVVGVIVATLTLATSGGDRPPHFDVVLDNAFGLTTGADVRVAGVTVGSVSALKVQARTARAVVTAEVDRPEFGGLRTDAFCEVEPQSLIGEYFLDCDPGRAPARLGDGGTVPISQTAGTIPPDLVASVLRRPVRERLGILISELGAGFAARGGDVNATISRALPALRETNRVLAVLSDERATLAQLTRDADVTLGALAGNRDDVARFVAEARDTASASASRRTELAATIRRFPGFLRELRPTLSALGEVARTQTPALRDLRAAAPALTTLLQRLGPFSDAARPAIRALGEASVTGERAVRVARPTVRRVRTLAASAPEPATNLRFVLEHLDDRSNAVEPNPQSPTGKGFTGLEALLQYFFRQSQAINLFDDRGYMLKIGLLVNECSRYTDASGAAADPGRAKRCSAALGPGGPTGDVRSRDDAESDIRRPTAPRPSAAATPEPTPAAPSPAPSTAPGAPSQPGAPTLPVPELGSQLSGVLDFLLGP